MTAHAGYAPSGWFEGFLDRIATCNRHDLGRFVPLRVAARDAVAPDARVGAVRRDRLQCLAGSGIEVAGDTAWLPAENREARDARLAALVAMLADVGQIRPATGERYAVATAVGQEPVAVVDRAAVAWLGVAASGVHVNGYVRRADGAVDMWVAIRSRDKATFPGMLDNMVAGGQGVGVGYAENVVKECGEEAGIPADVARRARAVGAVRYVYENETGLKPDTMFCFDLELPADFVPTPTDGEVERFELWPLEAVAERVARSTDFKFNCNLVVIDFLLRHGRLDPDDPRYPAIVDGLHRGPPRFALPAEDGSPRS